MLDDLKPADGLLTNLWRNSLMVKRSKPPRSVPLKRDVDQPLVSRTIVKTDPRQSRLLFDPMPERVEPALAKLTDKVPTGRDWQYEIKWDGYRLAIHVELNGVRIITRGGHNWTARFPTIAAAARDYSPRTLILDGEAVVLDEQGRSDFNALQQALGGRGGKRSAASAIFYAFDLLYLDGHDLTKMGQHERRELLRDLIHEDSVGIKFSESVEADGEQLLQSACELGLEGIIAKHQGQPYRSGRTGDWLKIKCVQSDSFVIVGYEPSSAITGAIARLLLARQNKRSYDYVGSVGTGFKHAEARTLRKTLHDIRTPKPVIEKPGKNIIFTRPDLIAEIEYRGWTDDGKLRHASFKGLRERADQSKV